MNDYIGRIFDSINVSISPYDYDVRLYEAHHDLYIEVYYKGKVVIMIDLKQSLTPPN